MAEVIAKHEMSRTMTRISFPGLQGHGAGMLKSDNRLPCRKVVLKSKGRGQQQIGDVQPWGSNTLPM